MLAGASHNVGLISEEEVVFVDFGPGMVDVLDFPAFSREATWCSVVIAREWHGLLEHQVSEAGSMIVLVQI